MRRQVAQVDLMKHKRTVIAKVSVDIFKKQTNEIYHYIAALLFLCYISHYPSFYQRFHISVPSFCAEEDVLVSQVKLVRLYGSYRFQILLRAQTVNIFFSSSLSLSLTLSLSGVEFPSLGLLVTENKDLTSGYASGQFLRD